MRPGQAPCLTGLRCFSALLPHHPPCPSSRPPPGQGRTGHDTRQEKVPAAWALTHHSSLPLIARRLPLVGLARNHLEARQPWPVLMRHQPPAQVRREVLLELPPTPRAGVAMDVPRVEHPPLEPPAARRDHGAVAVRAQRRIRLPPDAL